jgi:hypothetical protein
MALYQRQYLGKYAVVQYGSRLLNADTYRVTISGEVIDVTNIAVFEPMQVRLPAKRNEPTGQLDPTSPFDHPTYFANFGTPTTNMWGGKRSYQVNITGKTYKDYDGNYLPNIGDYVKIVLTDAAPAVAKHPRFVIYCIVTSVEFSNDVRGYNNWSMTAEGTNGLTTSSGEGFVDNSIVPEGL